MRQLRCALAQINSTVGDLDGNAARIAAQIEAAEAAGADIVAFPELALTGYPPEDLVCAAVSSTPISLPSSACATPRAAFM